MPDKLGALWQSLLQLFVDHNQLTELPDSLGKLRHLSTLVVSGNKLAALPASLARLDELKELRANDCELTDLPSGMQDMVSLVDLQLACNKCARDRVPHAAGSRVAMHRIVQVRARAGRDGQHERAAARALAAGQPDSRGAPP